MCSFPNDSFTLNTGDLPINSYRTPSGMDSMFKAILTILDISDLSVICPANLLSDIGMDFAKQYQMKKKLREDFGVELMDGDLETMTIGKLYDLSIEVQQFQNQLIRNKKLFENKLLNFKLFIGLAEDGIRLEYPSTIMYEMVTKYSRLNSATCTILLPGLDNDVTKFVDLAHSISFSTFIVKYGNKEMFVDEFTTEILQDITRLCHDKQSFKLVGYSFGSLVAIELARALEGRNKNVQVICIDGSPLLFQRSFDSFTCERDGESSFNLELATYIAHSFYLTKLPSLFRYELRRLKSWNSKVQWLTDLIRKLYLNIPEENFRSICNGVFNRTHAAAVYEFDAKRSIRSPITLIKSSEEVIPHVTYDFGLKLCTKKCIDVNIVCGNHYTILENCEILNVINEIKY